MFALALAWLCPGCGGDSWSEMEGEPGDFGGPGVHGRDAGEDGAEDGGTLDLLPYTTVRRTLEPLLAAAPLPKEDRSGWGTLETGPGEPFLPRDDLGVGAIAAKPQGKPSSLAFFWQITDIHIIDEESPARLIHGDQMVTTAYRYQEAWSTQVFEATIRTGNAFSKSFPFDFVLLTGDMVESGQKNELQWFLSVMNGGEVNPDSGRDNDPLPDSGLDPHDPFFAEGLDRTLPWYALLGNHDEMIMGFANDNLGGVIAAPEADTASQLSAAVIPTCLEVRWDATDPVKPARCYVPPRSYFQGRKLVPDPERRFLRGREFMEPFFGTETLPDGHGFGPSNAETGAGFYTVDGILPGLPSMLIVLETASHILNGGHIDDAQLAWLENELDRAEQAGKIAIVASHHPSREIDRNHDPFVRALGSHPNVILHLAGHSHFNRIAPRPAVQGVSEAHGYWEIETASVIDWPQQTRILEIVDNRDGTGAIYCTMLDYEIPEDLPSVAGGRFYSLYDVQDGNGELGTAGEPLDRNAILRFAWPEKIARVLERLPGRAVKSTLFQ